MVKTPKCIRGVWWPPVSLEIKNRRYDVTFMGSQSQKGILDSARATSTFFYSELKVKATIFCILQCVRPLHTVLQGPRVWLSPPLAQKEPEIQKPTSLAWIFTASKRRGRHLGLPISGSRIHAFHSASVSSPWEALSQEDVRKNTSPCPFSNTCHHPTRHFLSPRTVSYKYADVLSLYLTSKNLVFAFGAKSNSRLSILFYFIFSNIYS